MLDLFSEIDAIVNNIDGFFAIDTEERIVYMCDNLLIQIGKTREEAIGQSIRELIPTNRCYEVLKTGKKEIGKMYFVEGFTIVSNAYPIYKGDKIIGAFEYDVFANIGFVEEFLDKVDMVGEVQKIRKIKNEHKKARYSIDNIKGSGPAIQNLKKQIKAAANSNSTVMITGETGCGKELVAHAIHRLSQRSLFHFVKLNCAAIPSELFESEIFGYEEGSFTGARKGGQYGKAEIANNGTLFLDEIDNLTLNMQAKLLRFLQEREVLRVGAEFPIVVNTRIIAATNRMPKSLVENNIMREDLYYRLNVIEIVVPPLRERKEDIPETVESLIVELNDYLGRAGNKVTGIEDNAMKILMRYDWPGNVRELRNIVERAMNNCKSGKIKKEHLDDFIKTVELGNGNDCLTINMENKSLHQIKKEIEQQVIVKILENNMNNYTKTALDLGISRQMLHRKLKDIKINDVN